MKKVFLLMTTALFSFDTRAATEECVDAPSCTDLGYTRTADECPDGSVKCPWNTGLVFVNAANPISTPVTAIMKRQEPTNAAITMPPAAVTPDIIGQTGNAWPTALHA